jgi:hypothetical protein
MRPLQVSLQQILADERFVFARRADFTDERPFSRVAGLVALAFVLPEESHGTVQCRRCESTSLAFACLEFDAPNTADE